MARHGDPADPVYVTGSPGGSSAVTEADGANAALGTTTDGAGASTAIGLLKNIKAALAAALHVVIDAGTNVIGRVGHDTTGLGTLRKAIAAVGTAEALAANQAAKWALVQCAPANTQGICVGDANVVAAAGTVRGTFMAPGDPPTLIPCTNLNQIFVDVRVNGEAASVTYGT